MAMGRRPYPRLRVSSLQNSFPMAHISRVPHDLLSFPNVKDLDLISGTDDYPPRYGPHSLYQEATS